MATIKRLPLLLTVLLAACSTRPPYQLPPVVDASAPSMDTQPLEEPAAPVVEAVPENRASQGAVVALLGRAEDYRQAGDTEAASATLERALRIDPRNAGLWHRLAAVRLQQDRAAQAEQLALKSNGLATGDRALQALNWALVARARWAQDDAKGAQAAERKAADARR